VPLRPAILKDINQAIEEGDFFVADDFVVRENQDNHEIVYLHQEEIRLVFRFPDGPKEDKFGQQKYRVSLSYSPGYINDTESEIVDGLPAFLSEIKKWAQRIRKDIEAEPAVRQWTAHRVRVEEVFGKLSDIDSSTMFSKTEIETLKEKLDKIETDRAAQLQQQSQSETQLKQDLAQLHAQVEALKVQLSALNKKSWVRAAVSRMFSWGIKKENQQFLIEAAKTVHEIAGKIHKS
jgi:hypothetical protein